MTVDETRTITPDVALANVMGSYRYDMTEFETKVWTKIIDATPPDRFLAFLSHHYQTSTFPPKPSDATKFLDTGVNPDAAYMKLERLVRQLGPYQEPKLDDDPVLVATVLNMGGWVEVNERMPDPSDSFAHRAFRERFDANFNQALVQVRINKELPAERLLPIGKSAATLALGAPAAPSHSAALLAIASAKSQATAAAPGDPNTRAQRFGERPTK